MIITSDHGMAGYKRKYEVSKVLKDKANRFYGGNELVVTITDITQIEQKLHFEGHSKFDILI